MRTRLLSLLLVGNVLLLGACAYLVLRYGLSGARREAPALPAADEGEPLDFTRAAPAQVATSDVPGVIYQTNQFRWSQLESTNYWTYIQNLRAAGCPEQTIKDIVVTDIMRLFAQRRGQHYHDGAEFKFWETNDKRTLTARQLEEREKALSQIDKELPAVLRELLGINYERELNKYFVDTGEDDRRLAFLPEAKREQVLALRDRFEGLRERLQQADAGQSPDRDALRRAEEQHKAALLAVLSPAEFEEYLLRTSETADRLRSELVGFDPSETEFREVFRLAYDYHQRFLYAAPEERTAQDEARRRLDRDVHAMLGPERALEYERSQNAEYRQLVVMARRYELPNTTAQSVFEMKRTAEEARASLMANRTLAPTSREAALRAIQEETESTVRRALGDQLYSAYSENGGEWIQSLNAADSPR